MPLGIQRVNARASSHPTPHVAFIKSLPGPGQSHAEHLLARVAAICHPILAQHHLAVMTLEEHEPNAEFLGRNFNAGEVIQLVLRRRKGWRRESDQSTALSARTNSAATSASAANGDLPAPSQLSSNASASSSNNNNIHTVSSTAGRLGPGSDPAPAWLPFRSIVLVMLHELAHCVHMNHRPAFWAVRAGFAEEMRALWARGYTGEGPWGRGRMLGRAEDDGETSGLLGSGLSLEEGGAAEVCGGVYRRRKRRGKGGANGAAAGETRKRKRGDGGYANENKDKNEQASLTYAERQQRRIRRKFGAGGTALGDDEWARAALERAGPKAKGTGRPRVAQSARGRELRAQAALARLAQGSAGTAIANGSGAVGTGKAQVKQELRQATLPFVKAEPGVKREAPEITGVEREPLASTVSEAASSNADSDATDTASDTDSDTGADELDGTMHPDDVVQVCPDTGAEVDRGKEGDRGDHVKAERQELLDLYAIPLAAPSP